MGEIVDRAQVETSLKCPDCNEAYLRLGTVEYDSTYLYCPNCGYKYHTNIKEAASWLSLKS